MTGYPSPSPMNLTAAYLAEHLKVEAVGDGSPHQQAKRQQFGLQKLPDMIVRMCALEKQVAALAARLG